MAEQENIDLEEAARTSVVTECREAVDGVGLFNIVASSAAARQKLLGQLMTSLSEDGLAIRGLNAKNHRRDFTASVEEQLKGLRGRRGVLLVDHWTPRAVAEGTLGQFQRLLSRTPGEGGRTVVFATVAPLAKLQEGVRPRPFGPELLEEMRELNYDAKVEILRRAREGDEAAQKMAESFVPGKVAKALGIGVAAVGLGVAAKKLGGALFPALGVTGMTRGGGGDEVDEAEDPEEQEEKERVESDAAAGGTGEEQVNRATGWKEFGRAIGMGLASLLPGAESLASMVSELNVSAMLSKADLEKIQEYLEQHHPDLDGEMEAESQRAVREAATALAWQKFLRELADDGHSWIREEARQLGFDLGASDTNLAVYLERTGQTPSEFAASLFRPSDLRRVFGKTDLDGSRQDVLTDEFEAWLSVREEA